MKFEVGQDVVVLRRGEIERIAKVAKVTHGGKRVHAEGLAGYVFDERGREKTVRFSVLRIEPATDEHRRTIADMRERAALWKVLDNGIASDSFDARKSARDVVSTETLRQVVALLRAKQ